VDQVLNRSASTKPTIAPDLVARFQQLNPGMPLPEAPAQPIIIGELRGLQQTLGRIAFPDRLAGATIVDNAEVANARRLWGAITDDVSAAAHPRGCAPCDGTAG
jgi:hypothetical protein